MSAPKKLTLRVQSAEGTARVEALASDATAELYERVRQALQLSSFCFALHRDRARLVELPSSRSRTLADAGLQHGDMLYLVPVDGADIFPRAEPEPEPSTSHQTPSSNNAYGSSSTAQMSVAPALANGPVEDEVDLILYKQSGKIERQRDEKLCRHGPKGRCVHCSALEPWDEQHLRALHIKHLSFHAYLRKAMAAKFVSLDELSLEIKPGCSEHPPWPRGICSKCQPGAVTLLRQPYRHVDNILMESGAMVERFLAAWRATGHQRLGWLYGTYEPHPDVPLGIRARVSAIYEPAQVCTRDSISLLADDKEAPLQQLAAALGLRRVGWLFTDLLPHGNRVQCIRGVDSHFLSAQECITAGRLQAAHRSACRLASSGYYGSKFVTVCVTGDSSGQIALEGYQVSGQCQALAQHGMLLPTKDAPELAYVPDSTRDKYVPHVYYKERDQYGNEVSVSGKRLPVAYLLVDVPLGHAATPQPHAATPQPHAATPQPHAAATQPPAAAAGSLFSPAGTFPPANRSTPRDQQGPLALKEHIDAAPSFLEAMSDLHVLLYLASNPIAPLSADALAPLLAALRARDQHAADCWRRSPPAAALDHLLASADHHPHSGSSLGDAEGLWTCPHCTFHNDSRRDACDMCALPR